jgi:predicted nucleic acid-binding protein
LILVDTSVWVAVLRDVRKRRVLEAALAGSTPVLSRFTQHELLAAVPDERQWDLLNGYLAAQEYLELGPESWPQAARICFDVGRRTRTPADVVDCCVAQLAIDHDALLLHRDRQFEAIAKVRSLRHRRLAL